MVQIKGLFVSKACVSAEKLLLSDRQVILKHEFCTFQEYLKGQNKSLCYQDIRNLKREQLDNGYRYRSRWSAERDISIIADFELLEGF